MNNKEPWEGFSVFLPPLCPARETIPRSHHAGLTPSRLLSPSPMRAAHEHSSGLA